MLINDDAGSEGTCFIMFKLKYTYLFRTISAQDSKNEKWSFSILTGLLQGLGQLINMEYLYLWFFLSKAECKILGCPNFLNDTS